MSTTHSFQLVYIGLGSNQGNKLELSRQAIVCIAHFPEVRDVKVSSFYESEPHTKNPLAPDGRGVEERGKEDEHWYVNAVLELQTTLSPEALFQRLLSVEAALGRNLAEKGAWLSRPIDLDLLAYGNKVMATDGLVVPHPRIAERRFVLLPWAELAPRWVHPVLGRSIQRLLDEVVDDKVTKPLCFS